MKKDVKIWWMYPNGQVKDQTHVLWPHFADGRQCTGYDGDVVAWSEHNKKHRWGCAQIVQHGTDKPVVLYTGNVSVERLEAFVEEQGALDDA